MSGYVVNAVEIGEANDSDFTSVFTLSEEEIAAEEERQIQEYIAANFGRAPRMNTWLSHGTPIYRIAPNWERVPNQGMGVLAVNGGWWAWEHRGGSPVSFSVSTTFPPPYNFISISANSGTARHGGMITHQGFNIPNDGFRYVLEVRHQFRITPVTMYELNPMTGQSHPIAFWTTNTFVSADGRAVRP